MQLNKNTKDNYTSRQLKLPLEIEKIIDISDPVYTFCEVMDHIDLSRYFVEKDYKTGAQSVMHRSYLKLYSLLLWRMDSAHSAKLKNCVEQISATCIFLMI